MHAPYYNTLGDLLLAAGYDYTPLDIVEESESELDREEVMPAVVQSFAFPVFLVASVL